MNFIIMYWLYTLLNVNQPLTVFNELLPLHTVWFQKQVQTNFKTYKPSSNQVQTKLTKFKTDKPSSNQVQTKFKTG